ncbi:hypothetical protein ACOSQ4_012806 [Xanthoceras sorbifolium]
MLVWVRLSTLPMEWLGADLLREIGGLLGDICKVDYLTQSQARGRFARICVEIDVSKPLRGTLKIAGRRIKVEYESMGIICYKCGRIGHSQESCREDVQNTKGEGSYENNTEAPIDKVDEAPKSYGPWLTLSYNKNHKNINS